ncbi:hypothetical protein NE865_12831 [Phthorimaea operculella]|nr:hypothetical protein NE865_12831 [Phthorimaea operculella]
MDVFLMIRRKTNHLHRCKGHNNRARTEENDRGILKVPPGSQMLFNKDSTLMEDDKTLAEYGLTSATAKAQCPAPIGLALRTGADEGNWRIRGSGPDPYSSPPDLPDVMKSQETNGQEQMDQH